MSLETLPLLLGLLVILIGGLIAADAWTDPEFGVLRDRRRRVREVIDHPGEKMVGIGTVLLGAALVGRDGWRFGTLAVLAGTVLVIWGGVRNRTYMKEILLFRGEARRGLQEPGDKAKKKMRIR